MSAVLKRKVFFIRIQLLSPLNVSSGEDEWTDADVLRDGKGNPFVAGTSLAGAMRAYLEKEKNNPCFMGYSGKNGIGKMSSLFISDLNFEEKVNLGVRDGVALNEEKVSITGSKYDLEILEAEAMGSFYMELVIRDGDNEEEMDNEISTLFQGIQNGEVRLGSKKTRGFGRFKITSLSVWNYEKANYLEYADAYSEDLRDKGKNELDEWLAKASCENKMIHIEVPLRMKGGISIRQYSAKKNEPDFVQLTDHGKPVIPGSSFAGAIRHRMDTILRELEIPEAGTMIQTAFGYTEKEESCASDIIISEAEIKEAQELTMVRTGISRFESAAKEHSLYKEKTYVDGKLRLEVSVRKGKPDTKWMLGFLLLALKDLQNGFLAVGGQTAIGRGVFEPDGPILIDGKKEDAQFIQEAFKSLEDAKGGKR